MTDMTRLFRRGFTLIELLIVILIIGVLAGLIMKGVALVRDKANNAAAKAMVSAIDNGLRVYREDTGYYPGSDAPADPEDPASNVISVVVTLLDRKGFVKINEADKAVIDGDTTRPLTADERADPDTEIVVTDPWGEIYVARENESKQRKESWMRNRDGMDVYSKGKNIEDDTVLGTEGPDNDDIGNW
ncbi:MAG TPA: hypothetical protein DCM87_01615 [Planctomycetes bacterium]|nr:hypothetical protein [Planctomycetota bacterium]